MTDDEPKRLIDVHPNVLARNVVSSLIMAKGSINLWGALIERLLQEIHGEVRGLESELADMPGQMSSQNARHEIERLRKSVEKLAEDRDAGAVAYRMVMTRLAARADALVKYGRHKPDCTKSWDETSEYECSCGLDAALKG